MSSPAPARFRIDVDIQPEQGDHSRRWNGRSLFPHIFLNFDSGNINHPKFDQKQLGEMRKTCQHHCFLTLNHNLGSCYNDARVVKWVWIQVVTNRLKGGARSFED